MSFLLQLKPGFELTTTPAGGENNDADRSRHSDRLPADAGAAY